MVHRLGQFAAATLGLSDEVYPVYLEKVMANACRMKMKGL